ncbi:ABC transporter ATP-binding protein [Flavicella sediminum]|uniref:ABC transporter ATP-binding protein n=1 Tax=Flavicella sediminum TaxID=2585141 RepID=UPI0011232758|nr:ABC transporter ATP-binding protein [Flavicella sediminum]
MLNVQKVTFAYTKREVVKDVSFFANKGEYIAIIGESGCGKSTLLEIIYGLLHIDQGVVSWDGIKLLGPNHYLIPGEPFMKYLSQDFDLMPFTTVEENIGKFLPNRFPKKKRERTAELLEVVDMVPFAKTKVKNLSGGQKQRVALARVLAKEPELLLLDEPFSHIDNFRKNNLRRKLFSYLKSKNIGCLVATHDSTDALSFADKILVMKEGRLVSVDTPQNLYQNPKSKYVASFFGDVNEIKIPKLENKILLYPDEIKCVEKSAIKAVVKHSFFKEGLFLVEALYNKQTIFFNHSKALETSAEICLEFSTEAIQKRT